MRPQSCYFVCFTARSGSTMLCEALVNTGVAGRPEEYFPDDHLFVATGAALQRAEWVQDWRNDPFAENLQRVFDWGTTPNGVFSAKLKANSLPFLQAALGEMPGNKELATGEALSTAFPNLRYIWVTRRDKVRQAISYFRAKQSRQWQMRAGKRGRKRTLQFNFPLIERVMREITQHEAAWAQFFADSRIVPFTVVYEDLVLDYEGTVRRALEYLQIPLPAAFAFPPPRLQKQADAVSEEWVRRYYESQRANDARRMIANIPAMLKSEPLRDTYLLPRLRRELGSAPARLKQQVLRSRTESM